MFVFYWQTKAIVQTLNTKQLKDFPNKLISDYASLFSYSRQYL